MTQRLHTCNHILPAIGRRMIRVLVLQAVLTASVPAFTDCERAGKASDRVYTEAMFRSEVPCIRVVDCLEALISVPAMCSSWVRRAVSDTTGHVCSMRSTCLQPVVA